MRIMFCLKGGGYQKYKDLCVSMCVQRYISELMKNTFEFSEMCGAPIKVERAFLFKYVIPTMNQTNVHMSA